MVTVTILAVGKLKEHYHAEAVAEYQKRLAAFCRFQVIELPEVRLPQNPSATEITKALEQEGAAILGKIPPRSRMMALCIEGKSISSEDLAKTVGQICGEVSQLVFVIGSSHGLSDKVKKAADFRLSMSAMTFPHQLARVMVCEQVYRAFSILAGTQYHK